MAARQSVVLVSIWVAGKRLLKQYRAPTHAFALRYTPADVALLAGPDPKKPGRIKRVYRTKDAMTPLDKLASLSEAAKFLREGVTLATGEVMVRPQRCFAWSSIWAADTHQRPAAVRAGCH